MPGEAMTFPEWDTYFFGPHNARLFEVECINRDIKISQDEYFWFYRVLKNRPHDISLVREDRRQEFAELYNSTTKAQGEDARYLAETSQGRTEFIVLPHTGSPCRDCGNGLIRATTGKIYCNGNRCQGVVTSVIVPQSALARQAAPSRQSSSFAIEDMSDDREEEFQRLSNVSPKQCGLCRGQDPGCSTCRSGSCKPRNCSRCGKTFSGSNPNEEMCAICTSNWSMEDDGLSQRYGARCGLCRGNDPKCKSCCGSRGDTQACPHCGRIYVPSSPSEKQCATCEYSRSQVDRAEYTMNSRSSARCDRSSRNMEDGYDSLDERDYGSCSRCGSGLLDATHPTCVKCRARRTVDMAGSALYLPLAPNCGMCGGRTDLGSKANMACSLCASRSTEGRLSHAQKKACQPTRPGAPCAAAKSSCAPSQPFHVFPDFDSAADFFEKNAKSGENQAFFRVYDDGDRNIRLVQITKDGTGAVSSQMFHENPFRLASVRDSISNQVRDPMVPDASIPFVDNFFKSLGDAQTRLDREWNRPDSYLNSKNLTYDSVIVRASHGPSGSSELLFLTRSTTGFANGSYRSLGGKVCSERVSHNRYVITLPLVSMLDKYRKERQLQTAHEEKVRLLNKAREEALDAFRTQAER